MSNIRKGFTLVELLIVIVVIGVLAAMLIFSSTEAISSARASNIVAGLTTFKKALTVFYINNHEKIYQAKDGSNTVYKLKDCGKNVNNLGDLMKNNASLVTKYIGNASSLKFSTNSNYTSLASKGSYRFEDNGAKNGRNAWFVGYILSEADRASGVAEKLIGRAKTNGLLSSQGTTGSNASGSHADAIDITYYAGGDVVWMKVLDLE